MTGKDFRAAASVVAQVTEKGAYVNIALGKAPAKAVRLLVYGVLEKYYSLGYICDTLCEKLKNNLRPYMLTALYCVLYTDMPFQAVTKVVCEGLAEGGKGAVKGFFTAVLAKADRAEYSLPAIGKKGYDEVRYNMPSWLIGMYKKEYPDRYGEIIENSEKHRTHIVSYCDEGEILAADPNAERTETGFFVKNGDEMSRLFADGKITYMSLGSTLVCRVAGDVKGKTLLDCCAAPGGKAVFFAKEGASVVACDVHDHRLRLIEQYARRMKVDLTVVKQDACVRNKEYENAFDVVCCDVPCSGLGVVDKKRDIVINRTYEDIVSLTVLQRDILENCCAYVKQGGVLLYSTCTLFSKENGDIVKGFVEKHTDFTIEEQKQYLPDGNGMEGFFVCRMRRN